jgi:hypothetical protein
MPNRQPECLGNDECEAIADSMYRIHRSAFPRSSFNNSLGLEPAFLSFMHRCRRWRAIFLLSESPYARA